MHQWVWSAQVGLLLGTITFVVAFVPILMLQYRRYGRMSFMRMLGAAATAIYITAIASYTWLPLPERSAAWCAQFGIDEINTTPFAFLDEWRPLVQEIGIRHALRTAVVLQVVFNVVLFIPWGIIARRFMQMPFILAVGSGFLASLFVEATQATGLWGIYDCAYRFADIDDLIMNTAGAFIGAVIAPVVLFCMPRTHTLVATRAQPRPITIWRRYASMLITMVTVVGGNFAAIVVVRMGMLVIERPIGDSLAISLERLASLLIVLTLFYLPAIAGSGNIGMMVTWLAPRWLDEHNQLQKGPMLLRIMRASVVGLPYLITTWGDWAFFNLLLWVAVVLSLIMVPFTSERRSFSCLVTGGTLVDTREGRLHPAE
ncbi:MAG: VanZ family protein [Thermomicrobiales bacterium]|nr:VanZ family protein [Thermomicrobiales bacterium]